MKLNTKGFGAIEVLLSIIAVALVFFVGFYVYNTNKTTNSTYNNSAKVAQQTVAKASNKQAAVNPSEANLKAYLLKTCSASDATAITNVFANKANQTVDTDNFQYLNGYAVVNVGCTLADGSQLTSLFAKFKNGAWDLVVKRPTSVSCNFLTQEGFPDSLKAPYCQNPGNFE